MISKEEKYSKYRPKKFLGQNFLVDDNIARKIIRTLDIEKDDTVVEIGPGHASLTKFLVNETNELIAVELDRGISEKLKKEFGEKIKIIHKDFLKIDFISDLGAAGNTLKIVGNIPYNITSEILFKLFDNRARISSAVIMMQKEVAKRLTAATGSKDYGILSIQTQIFSSPKILFDVPPSAFFPKPKVISSVVKFDFSELRYEIKNVTLLKELVRAAFGKRRKILSNALKDFFESKKINPDKLDLDLSKRAEELSVEKYAKLANEIDEIISKYQTVPLGASRF